MRLGVFGANVGAMATHECGRLARHAEELGYASVWTGEHPVLPRPRREKPPLDPEWPMADSLITLAHIAAHTRRIELCTGVLVLPQHHPVHLAKQIATLDVLSEGRLVVGFGVGHIDVEFAALGVPMSNRRARAREYLAAMRALWQSPAERFAGDYVSFEGVDAYPKPHRVEGPTIVLGGTGDLALEDAATLGQGWYGFGQTPDQAAPVIRRLRELVDRRGGDPAAFKVSLTPRARLDPGMVDAYRAAGVDQLVVSVEASTTEGILRRLEHNAPSKLGILEAA